MYHINSSFFLNKYFSFNYLNVKEKKQIVFAAYPESGICFNINYKIK